jgi:signal peptidase I
MKRIKNLLIKWILMIFVVILFGYFMGHYGITLSIVNGTSMQPTLHNNDRLLINKFKFLLDSPKIGEVIIFKDPSQVDRFLVKRVIGVSGDTIKIRDGVLYRNGQSVDEPYIDTSIEDGDYGPVTVRNNTVFVMGDNRHRYASRDSRYVSVGFVPLDLIEGKVEYILWRPSLAAFL